MDEEKKKNKYRLFGLISPVDVVILALIVALVAWAALVFSAPESAQQRTDDAVIQYVVELAEKPEGFYTKVESGAALYDATKGYLIGTVVGAYALPYLEDAPDEPNGIIRRTEVSGLEFTYIVVETAARISENSTMAGQYEILVNKEVFVKSKEFAGQGYICSIELK